MPVPRPPTRPAAWSGRHRDPGRRRPLRYDACRNELASPALPDCPRGRLPGRPRHRRGRRGDLGHRPLARADAGRTVAARTSRRPLGRRRCTCSSPSRTCRSSGPGASSTVSVTRSRSRSGWVSGTPGRGRLLWMLAGVAALVGGTLLGWSGDFLEALVTLPPVLRAALVGLSVVAGLWCLRGAVARIEAGRAVPAEARSAAIWRPSCAASGSSSSRSRRSRRRQAGSWAIPCRSWWRSSSRAWTSSRRPSC